MNAGCRVTSIQKFLGHKKLNTTMIYARAHDQTVAQDYFTAMTCVERRLALVGDGGTGAMWIGQDQVEKLLGLAEQLLQSNLSFEHCWSIAIQIREILTSQQLKWPSPNTQDSFFVFSIHHRDKPQTFFPFVINFQLLMCSSILSERLSNSNDKNTSVNQKHEYCKYP